MGPHAFPAFGVRAPRVAFGCSAQDFGLSWTSGAGPSPSSGRAHSWLLPDKTLGIAMDSGHVFLQRHEVAHFGAPRSFFVAEPGVNRGTLGLLRGRRLSFFL